MKRRLATLVLLVSAVSATPVSAQWLTLATPGVPRTADGKPDLSAPAPRTADGRPELTGLWRGAGMRGDLRDETQGPGVGAHCDGRAREQLLQRRPSHAVPAAGAELHRGCGWRRRQHAKDRAGSEA